MSYRLAYQWGSFHVPAASLGAAYDRSWSPSKAVTTTCATPEPASARERGAFA